MLRAAAALDTAALAGAAAAADTAAARGAKGGGGGATAEPAAVVAEASAAPAAAVAIAAAAGAPLASTAAATAAPTRATAAPLAATAPSFAPFVFGAKPPEPPTYDALAPASAGQIEAGVVGAMREAGLGADPHTVMRHVARIEMQLLIQAAATAHKQTIRAGRFAAMATRAEAARRVTATANAGIAK